MFVIIGCTIVSAYKYVDIKMLECRGTFISALENVDVFLSVNIKVLI